MDNDIAGKLTVVTGRRKQQDSEHLDHKYERGIREDQ
jgi:hypothetical protein